MILNMKFFLCLSITTVFVLLGLNVFAQPNVSFISSQMVVCAPANISFTNTTTGCVGTPSYLWNAGNGDVSNLENPTFNYSVGGNYTVSLTVYCDGYQVTQTMDIVVQELIAEFNLLENNISCYPATIELIQMSSVIPVGTNLNYQWEMGNGDTINNIEQLSYTYSMPGNYTIMFNISTDAGCADSYSQLLTVGGPYAEVFISDDSVCVGQDILFEALNVQNVDNVYWVVGDGSFYTDQSFAHSFDMVPPEGYYNVAIHLSSGDCQSVRTFDIYVFDLPADVMVVGGGSHYGYPVVLNATGGEGGTIYWQSTNSGGISTEVESTSQSVSENGMYYFRSMSGQGCWGGEGSAYVEIIDSIDIELVITPASGVNSPDASVEVVVTGGVEPYTITCNQAKSGQNFTDLLPGTYTVLVTDFLGNSESETFVVGWSGLDLFGSETTDVYPNPANGLLSVHSGNLIPDEIQIVNLSGKAVYNVNPDSEISWMDISNLETGMYFILIKFKEKTVKQKLIIKDVE